MKKKMICALMLALLAVMMSATALACDHNFGPWKTKTSGSCTRQEHQFRYCQKCDHWEQRRLPKLPHTPGEMTVTKAPTCTEKGRQEAICSVCNRLVRYNIDMLPHTYGEMTVVTEPTCTQNGKGQYTCTVCGKHKYERIDKLGHDWGEMTVTKEPTCKKTGAGETPCARCSARKTQTIDRLAHVFGEFVVKQEPEGKKKGLREAACTLCGDVRAERFYAEGTLYEDMEPCPEVITLQEQLRDLGYYKGNIRTGTFGSMTGESVERFQRDNALEPTGLADLATREAIERAWMQATGSGDAALTAQDMASAAQAQPIGE